MKKIVFNKTRLELIITDYKIVQIKPKFRKNKVTTFLINNEFYVALRDRLIYDCEKCGKSVSRIFSLRVHFLCKRCNTENTCVEKYGVSHVSKVPEIRKRIKETNIKRYGVACILSDKKKKENGMMEKFGVKYAMQSKEIKQKVSQTNIKKYGFSCLLGDQEWKVRKVRDKYGVDNVFQSEIIKQKNREILIKKYGFDNASKSPIIKEKIRKNLASAMIQKYGVENAMQIPEIAEKVSRSKSGVAIKNRCKWFSIEDQFVQGQFELTVAKFLTENNIKWIAHKGIQSIQYEDVSLRRRYYYPDFYLLDSNVYLDPHAKYFWNEKFIHKIKQCNKLGYKIFAFDEYLPLNSILEYVEKHCYKGSER